MDELVLQVVLGYLFAAGGIGVVVLTPSGWRRSDKRFRLHSDNMLVRFVARYLLFSVFHMVWFPLVAGLTAEWYPHFQSTFPAVGDRVVVLFLAAALPAALSTWGWIRLVRWWEGTDPDRAGPWWQKQKPPWEG